MSVFGIIDDISFLYHVLHVLYVQYYRIMVQCLSGKGLCATLSVALTVCQVDGVLCVGVCVGVMSVLMNVS